MKTLLFFTLFIVLKLLFLKQNVNEWINFLTCSQPPLLILHSLMSSQRPPRSRKPDLHSHLWPPAVLIQIWSHPPLSSAHSSLSLHLVSSSGWRLNPDSHLEKYIFIYTIHTVYRTLTWYGNILEISIIHNKRNTSNTEGRFRSPLIRSQVQSSD